MTTSKKFAGWLTGTVKVLTILFFYQIRQKMDKNHLSEKKKLLFKFFFDIL